MMEPRICTSPERKLAGRHITTSLAEQRTAELWRSFMPQRNQVAHAKGSALFSVEIYPTPPVTYDPHALFEKWAAVEVTHFADLPEGMDTLVIPEGLYAVFIHRGPASDAAKTFGHIFGTWLPASQYAADNRPYFGIMGEKYSNDSPDSEEEVWIPVRPNV